MRQLYQKNRRKGNMMLLKNFKEHIKLNELQEEFKKIGVNFITAGVVGVFINHYVGVNLSDMLWASISVTSIGIATLYFGLRKRKKL